MEVAQSKLKSINELGMCKYPQTSTNLALTVVTFLHFFFLWVEPLDLLMKVDQTLGRSKEGVQLHQ